ncbi:MAG: shikimate dehydrogenase [Paraprevotella sp.]|nr:shikimate dehydrogenase [Paraprevotella sp.]
MKTYGLVGYPLKHSFSRDFFNTKFADERIDAEYVNFEIPAITGFPEIIAENENLCGLNVTIPYKEQVIPYLDVLSEEARTIGAVNVIRVSRREDGRPYLEGHNSDVIGFMRSIKPLLEGHHRKALILGTGGASKAIRYGLEKLGLETTFVSRSRFPDMLTYDDITPAVLREYPVIVNCTPCGMYPHTEEAPKLPYEALDDRHLLYDLIYNPGQTRFLQRGEQAGAKVKNGLEMLHLQAQAGWEIWNRG